VPQSKRNLIKEGETSAQRERRERRELTDLLDLLETLETLEAHEAREELEIPGKHGNKPYEREQKRLNTLRALLLEPLKNPKGLDGQKVKGQLEWLKMEGQPVSPMVEGFWEFPATLKAREELETLQIPEAQEELEMLGKLRHVQGEQKRLNALRELRTLLRPGLQSDRPLSDRPLGRQLLRKVREKRGLEQTLVQSLELVLELVIAAPELEAALEKELETPAELEEPEERALELREFVKRELENLEWQEQKERDREREMREEEREKWKREWEEDERKQWEREREDAQEEREKQKVRARERRRKLAQEQAREQARQLTRELVDLVAMLEPGPELQVKQQQVVVRAVKLVLMMLPVVELRAVLDLWAMLEELKRLEWRRERQRDLQRKLSRVLPGLQQLQTVLPNLRGGRRLEVLQQVLHLVGSDCVSHETHTLDGRLFRWEVPPIH